MARTLAPSRASAMYARGPGKELVGAPAARRASQARQIRNQISFPASQVGWLRLHPSGQAEGPVQPTKRCAPASHGPGWGSFPQPITPLQAEALFVEHKNFTVVTEGNQFNFNKKKCRKKKKITAFQTGPEIAEPNYFLIDLFSHGSGSV